jgi:hypothetical protein
LIFGVPSSPTHELKRVTVQPPGVAVSNAVIIAPETLLKFDGGTLGLSKLTEENPISVNGLA